MEKGSRDGTPATPSSRSGTRLEEIEEEDRPRALPRSLIVGQLQEKKNGNVLSRLLRHKQSDGELQDVDPGGEEEGLVDIVEDLPLAVQPWVQELGDESILAMKRAGTLDVFNEAVLATFRKHKAMQGQVLFEAENANNIGVERFSYGDLPGAVAYFRKALEFASKERKPAAQELADLSDFLSSRFHDDVQSLYAALSDGDWRLALSRRRFVAGMQSLGYPGDADRVFSMMDSSGKSDGKVTAAELSQVLKARPSQLNKMDRDLVEKGIILSNIAACEMLLGKPLDAVQMLRDAAKIVLRGRGDDDTRSSRVVCNIAAAYILLGDHDSALNYLSRVLVQREASQGQQDPDVLSILYHIGYCFLVKANRFNILYDRKRMDSQQQQNPVEVNYSLALCAFKERLHRQQAVLEAAYSQGGDEDQLRLDVARSHEIIAEIYDQRAQLSHTVAHLQIAVDHKEQVLSPGDPDLLSAWNTLISACVRSGLLEEALELLEKAIEASVALFGEQSLSVATELFYLGLVHFRMGARKAYDSRREALGSYTLALQQLLRAQETRIELAGSVSLEVAATCQLLGAVFLALGEHREAKRQFESALLTRCKLLGPSHVAVASSVHALGCVYARTPRRQEEAVLLLRKAVRVRELRLSEDSLHLAESLHELGSVLLRQHEAEAALPLLSRAAVIRERSAGRRTLVYGASMQQVGEAHLQLGMHSEAKLYLQAALALRDGLSGSRSAQTAMSHYALGAALYELGEYSLALKQFKQSYAIREERFGAEHALSAESLHKVGSVYVHKGDLNAALPFLLRALDVRMSLNDVDSKARLEDSDEEDGDPSQSPREKRIKKRQQRKAARATRIAARMTPGKQHPSAWLEAAKGAFSKRPGPDPKDAKLAQPTFDSVGTESMPRWDSQTRWESQQLGSQQSRLSPIYQSVASSVWRDDAESEMGVEQVGVDVCGFLAGAIGDTMQLISQVYMDLKDFGQSKYYLDRALCLREEVYGSQSVEYGESLHLQGIFFERQGQHVPALKRFQQALRIREKVCGHTHESTADTCAEMGSVLALLGQNEDAGVYLLRAINVREQLFGPEDKTLQALREKWGKLAAAGMRYDPVSGGETLPHFARRSAESHLHGDAMVSS